jgi:hypothetical protein
MPVIQVGPHHAVAEPECAEAFDLAGEGKEYLAFRDCVKTVGVSARKMTGNIAVLAMPGTVDLAALNLAAQEFGWTARESHNPHEIAADNAKLNPVAAFLRRDIFGAGCSWVEAVRLFRHALPQVRLVVCHGVTEAIDWRELADAGAFHGIGFPLRDLEYRQSLGFIWEAEERDARSAERIPEVAPAMNLTAPDSLFVECFCRLSAIGE